MPILGLRFPFNSGLTGFPEKASDAVVVGDNIRRILETRRGERVMRPDEGSHTYEMVFESTGPVLSARVREETVRAIAVGEPRARVLRVDVEEVDEDEGTSVVCDVIFEVNSVVDKVGMTIKR